MTRIIALLASPVRAGLTRGKRVWLLAATIAAALFVWPTTTSAHITSLVPSSTLAGGPDFTLRILGFDFDQSDTGRVLFDGTRVTATLVSSEELTATIPANLIAQPRTVTVALEGFNSVQFTIYPPGDCRFSSISISGGDLIGQIFPSDGGSGTINISSASNCAWGVLMVQGAPGDRFISLTSATSESGSGLQGPGAATGRGYGTLTYSLTRNPSAARRTAVLRLHRGDFSGVLDVEPFTVTQEGSQCPASAYSISPLNAVRDTDAGTGSFQITAPRDCQWTAVRDRSWIRVTPIIGAGNATLNYTVGRNEGPPRSAVITIPGQQFFVFQIPSDCFIRTMCAYFPSACLELGGGLLTTSPRFRDEVLAKTPRGQRYTQLYYQFSKEAVGVAMLNPLLILRSQEVLQRYKPALESMIKGEQVTLTEADIEEIESFLNSFAQRGSPELREALKVLCEDLRDPRVHTEFNIIITDGPKRDLPAHGAVGRVKQMNRLTLFFGFALGGVLLVRFGRRKGRKALLSIALPLLLIATPWSAANGHQSEAQVLRAQMVCPSQHELIRGREEGFIPAPQWRATQQNRTAPSLHPTGPIRTGWQTNRPTRSHQARSASPLPAGINPSSPPVTLFGSVGLIQPQRDQVFEANHGQTNPLVRFLSRGPGYNLYLSPTEATLQLRNAECAMRIEMVGASPEPRIRGLDVLSGRANYFRGRDPAKWRANAPSYARVKYENLYKGIDLVYYGNQQRLEFDFIVAPGADPGQIKLGFEGADEVGVDSQGDLVLRVAGGEVRQQKPVAYQEVNGGRQEITCRYTLIQNPKSKILKSVVGFEVGEYDRSQPLIIDPVLTYSTYFGGNGNEEGNSIAVDSAGNVYVTGFTDSINFPLANSSQPGLGGGQQDAFVVKLDAAGRVVYSTYIGGNGQDNGTSIAVDSSGNAYVTGFTDSTNFPVRNALQPAKAGSFNAFVVKLDPAGALVNSTLLGGSGSDYGSSIAVDPAGNIYVGGIATSPNFPTVNAAQQALGGLVDAFVAKIDPSGTQLVYSTYFGGIGIDGASSIAVDSAGNTYLTGLTSSPNFRTVNALQSAHRGGLFDAFVAKLNPSGSEIIYSTYLGGGGEDRAFRIAVDSAGSAYVTGDTDSTNFPLANAAQQTNGGSADAFVAKLNPSGNQLTYSTYLGGSGIDGGTAIAVDATGSAYVTGFTASANFPTARPLQQVFGGGYDGFIARLGSSGSALDYSTYLGGGGIDSGFGIATDASGNAYVMGVTDSPNFPMVAPLQAGHGGGTADLFVAKIKTGPIVIRAEIQGKNLLVYGSGFDNGAKILLNGEEQKTRNDETNPTGALFGKKAGKKIAPGQTVKLQVRNSDGALSNDLTFTRL